MTERLPVSVVICVKNGEATIDRCLESALANNPAEIIVIDGNSSDRTVDIARKYTDKVFSDEGKGLGYARQLGVELATQDFVVFLDDDAYFASTDTLTTMLEELIRNQWDAINHYALLFTPIKCKESYWERAFYFHSLIAPSAFDKLRIAKRMPLPVGALSKKECLIKLRFDPFFKWSAEFVDLGLRFYEAGYKVGVSSVPVYHFPLKQLDFRGFVRHGIWLGKGDARLFWKHKSKSLRWIIYSVLRFPGWVFLCFKHKRPQYIPFFAIDWLSRGMGFVSEIISLLKQRFIGGEL